MAEEKVKQTKIDELIPDDKNFNKGTEYGNSLIEKSLRKFGAGRSILIDKNNRIIAGNKTIENASAIGLDDVIVVETDGKKIVAVKRTDIDLDSKEGRELALADNQTSAVNFSIDEDVLKDVSDELEIDLGEWGITFDEEENLSAEEDSFDESKDSVPTRCKLGDVWQLGNHRLMCGDATKKDDASVLMGDDRADMVFTDPPYNVGIGAKNRLLGANNQLDIIGDQGMTDAEIGETLWKPAFANMRDFSKDCCSIYVTMPQGGAHMMMMMMMMMSASWQVKHELIWEKNQPTFSMGRLDYDYKHEPICYGWNKNHKFYGGGEMNKSVWNYDKPRDSSLHPTMKPVALIGNALLNSSQKDDIVIDFFGGSGSTMIACEQLGRRCRMMELDPHFCDVIIARWEKESGQKAIKIRG